MDNKNKQPSPNLPVNQPPYDPTIPNTGVAGSVNSSPNVLSQPQPAVPSPQLSSVQPQPILSIVSSDIAVTPPNKKSKKLMVIMGIIVIVLVIAVVGFLVLHKSNKSLISSTTSTTSKTNINSKATKSNSTIKSSTAASCKIAPTAGLTCYNVNQSGATAEYSILFFPNATTQTVSGDGALESTDQSIGSPELVVTTNDQGYCKGGGDAANFTFTYQGSSETGCLYISTNEADDYAYGAVLTISGKSYSIEMISKTSLDLSVVKAILGSVIIN
jgi:hypothetical protein